jgi:hypothetical protein
MADYRLTQTEGVVIRATDGASIPLDPDNRDWQAFNAWVTAGGVPDPYVAPPLPVPISISDRQFFQQLALVGTITQADALSAVKVGTIPPALQGFVDAISDPAKKFAANMLLAGATVFERNHPLTEAIGEAQGMSPDQVDAFFTAAAEL